MSFPHSIYLAAFVTACVTTAVALPFWRWLSWRVGHLDSPGTRKIHTDRTPLAGGPAVLTGLALPLALAAGFLFLANGNALGDQAGGLMTYGFSRRSLQLVILVAGAGGMALLGWIDDRYVLRPATKLLGQFLIAAAVAAVGVRITLFVGSPVFSFLITVLWILTVTNACNFMDNMNGLCGGLGMIAAWCFAWTAAIQGQYLVAAMAFLVSGALLGFLPYNFPRASAFLGDSGSHLVGFILATLAILPDFYTGSPQAHLAVLKPLLILGVILGDLVWVVALRWRMGKPVYIGDTNHLSHRLVRKGLSRERAVLLIWLMSATLGALSFVW